MPLGTWNMYYYYNYIEHVMIDMAEPIAIMVNEEDIARLSPARYKHINPYGKYRSTRTASTASRSRMA
jgi:hypothetical protein